MEAIRQDLEKELGESVLEVRGIPEGHSGFTYWVELTGRTAVMRLPPPGARIAGPADIPRQGRIMDALSKAGLPVPPVIKMSEQPVVDGRPYYLVEAVEGERIEVAMHHHPARQLAASAVDVLRRMQALPIAKTGIGEEPGAPLQAEIMRWGWLMERAPEELTGDAPRLATMLGDRIPPEKPPVLVHADYHYGNMLFKDGVVVGLLDWEIAQIGQPLLDLACLSVVASASRMGAGVPGGGVVDVPDADLREMYGGDEAEYRWFLALTYYKYASIFGYNLMLHRRGKRPDPIYEERTTTIMEFIAEGIRLLGQEGAA